MPADIDLRAALNAISDVIQNRPRPLRDFDQIYMKAGDMVLQSELIARWADGKDLAFIGDGDAISVCVAYLKSEKIVEYGPKTITVFDFDERICNAITRFAEHAGVSGLRSELYNCLDAFPRPGQFNAFYTNPPWGASNDGRSVVVFMRRGMEACGYAGDGAVVVADDPGIVWPRQVLSRLQREALDAGYVVQRMMTEVHSYHLDDAPDLRSCNVLLRAVDGDQARAVESCPVTDEEELQHFYGREQVPRVRYVRERARLDYGKAYDRDYELEMLEGR